MTDQPLLSALTPSYNYAEFIRDALHSVAGLGPDVEHVVVDDGSPDQSVPRLLREWPGLTLAEQPNAGLGATLNRCLQLASGEWVGWLNADDFYLPAAVDALRTAPQAADVIYGDSVFVDDDGAMLRTSPKHRFSLSTLRRYGPFIDPPSFFVRRSAMPARGWDASTIKLMDWDLYLELAGAGARFHYVPAILGAFRIHSGQQSHRPTPRTETETVRDRHGLTGSARRWKVRRAVGGAQHSALKLLDGGYVRQVRARRTAGADLRWWKSSDSLETVARLR